MKLSKHPPTQRAHADHAVLGRAWDVSRKVYIPYDTLLHLAASHQTIVDEVFVSLGKGAGVALFAV